MPTTKFCTVAQVKAYLSGDEAYTGDDTMIAAHIETATALLRQFTRRDWERATFTQFFDTNDINIAIRQGNGYTQFQLKEKPVQSITSVKFNTAGDWTNTTALEARLYELDAARNRVILYPTLMNSYGRALQVVYVAGYPVNDSDADLLDVAPNLRNACAIQAAFTFRRVINETSGSKQKQDRKGLVNYAVNSSGLIGEALALVKSDTRLLVGGNA